MQSQQCTFQQGPSLKSQCESQPQQFTLQQSLSLTKPQTPTRKLSCKLSHKPHQCPQGQCEKFQDSLIPQNSVSDLLPPQLLSTSLPIEPLQAETPGKKTQ